MRREIRGEPTIRPPGIAGVPFRGGTPLPPPGASERKNIKSRFPPLACEPPLYPFGEPALPRRDRFLPSFANRRHLELIRPKDCRGPTMEKGKRRKQKAQAGKKAVEFSARNFFAAKLNGPPETHMAVSFDLANIFYRPARKKSCFEKILFFTGRERKRPCIFFDPASGTAHSFSFNEELFRRGTRPRCPTFTPKSKKKKKKNGREPAWGSIGLLVFRGSRVSGFGRVGQGAHPCTPAPGPGATVFAAGGRKKPCGGGLWLSKKPRGDGAFCKPGREGMFSLGAEGVWKKKKTLFGCRPKKSGQGNSGFFSFKLPTWMGEQGRGHGTRGGRLRYPGGPSKMDVYVVQRVLFDRGRLGGPGTFKGGTLFQAQFGFAKGRPGGEHWPRDHRFPKAGRCFGQKFTQAKEGGGEPLGLVSSPGGDPPRGILPNP